MEINTIKNPNSGGVKSGKVNKTKKYRVGFWYTVYGTVEMEAKSKIEAEEKVEETLKTNGLEDLDYKQHDLEAGAQDAELIKNYEKSFRK